MNTTIIGVALILIVCLADVVCVFLVARRTWKQETTTIESLPEMYLLAFASATECIEERRRSGERLRSRKGEVNDKAGNQQTLRYRKSLYSDPRRAFLCHTACHDTIRTPVISGYYCSLCGISLCVALVASSFLQRDGNIQRVDDPAERYDLPEWQEYNRLYDHMEQQGTGYTDEMRAAYARYLEAAKKIQE